jgi:hypothetical protein
MTEIEEQEPEILRDPRGTWGLGIGIAVLIVLIFTWAATRNTRHNQPWSPPSGMSAPG